MYMDTEVKVPEVPGKITFKPKGKAFYVLYELGRKYKKEKQYNIPRRVIIGKLVEGRKDMMIPNENYAEHFPKEAVSSLEAPRVRCNTLNVGSFCVIEKIVQEYGLDKMLEDNFGKKDAGLILDFASYMIISESNAAQHYPGYAWRHALFTEDMQVVSDSTISSVNFA